MRIDQPQPSPIIAVPFDVFAAQNRSYQIRGALAFLFRLAVGEDLIALCGADNKGFVAAGLDAIVDLDIPVFQWRPDFLNLTADACLDGRENKPAAGGGKDGRNGVLLYIKARK